MNQISFLFFLLFFSTFGYSQQMLDTITQETCDCIGGKDFDSFDAEQLNLELGFCMIESLNQHKEASTALNVNIYDAAGMRQLGEQVGTRMAITCPQIIAKMSNIANKAKSANHMEGTIVGIEGKEFGFVILQDAAGRSHKLLWLRYFKNSEQLISASAEIIGTRVRIEFEPIECYSPTEHDYFERKEITGIEFLKQ